MRPPRRRPVSLSSRYGATGEFSHWREIIGAYIDDHVVAAYQQANTLGAIGGGQSLLWYRMIEGEALTRSRSKIEKVTPWLQVETIEEEVTDGDHVREVIQSTCESISTQLRLKRHTPVMVSVLAAEANAPWHAARYGYFEPKTHYDKICIPFASTQNEEDLTAVVRHEFGHHVVTNLAGGWAPHWVQEGVAMLCEGRSDSAPISVFHSEPELNEAFTRERRNGENGQTIWAAYQQSASLIRHLHENGGDPKLHWFLRTFQTRPFWIELIDAALNRSPTTYPLKRVYRMKLRELFEPKTP